jgi:hypothetical protein
MEVKMGVLLRRYSAGGRGSSGEHAGSEEPKATGKARQGGASL